MNLQVQHEQLWRDALSRCAILSMPKQAKMDRVHLLTWLPVTFSGEINGSGLLNTNDSIWYRSQEDSPVVVSGHTSTEAFIIRSWRLASSKVKIRGFGSQESHFENWLFFLLHNHQFPTSGAPASNIISIS